MVFRGDCGGRVSGVGPSGCIGCGVEGGLRHGRGAPRVHFGTHFNTTVTTILYITIVMSILKVLSQRAPTASAGARGVALVGAMGGCGTMCSALRGFGPALFSVLASFLKDDSGSTVGTVGNNTTSNVINRDSATIGRGTRRDRAAARIRNISRTSVIGASNGFVCVLSTDCGCGARTLVGVISTARARPGRVGDVMVGSVCTERVCLVNSELVILNGDRGTGAITIVCSVSSPCGPGRVRVYARDNTCGASHLVDRGLCIVASFCIRASDVGGGGTRDFVPGVRDTSFGNAMSTSYVCLCSGYDQPRCAVIATFSVDSNGVLSTRSILNKDCAMCTDASGVVATSASSGTGARITGFGVSRGRVGLGTATRVGNGLLGRFSVSRCGKCFHFMLASCGGSADIGSLIILSRGFGRANGVASVTPNREICSMQFVNSATCFIAFHRISPLFDISLSSPRGPGVVKTLGVPNFSSCLFPFNSKGLLNVNEGTSRGANLIKDVGLSVFSVDGPTGIARDSGASLATCCSTTLSGRGTVLISCSGGVVSFTTSNTFCMFSCLSKGFARHLERRVCFASGVIHPVCVNSAFCVIARGSVAYFGVGAFSGLKCLRLGWRWDRSFR